MCGVWKILPLMSLKCFLINSFHLLKKLVIIQLTLLLGKLKFLLLYEEMTNIFYQNDISTAVQENLIYNKCSKKWLRSVFASTISDQSFCHQHVVFTDLWFHQNFWWLIPKELNRSTLISIFKGWRITNTFSHDKAHLCLKIWWRSVKKKASLHNLRQSLFSKT